ncbi:MAG: tRNA dihydrouridine synthase, partial [Patescibacteria group bacterium]
EPEKFYKAAAILEQMGFDGLDINFGCPAYKVVKNGGGVSLMRNPQLCQEIVQATCEGSNLPVSLKMRASIKKDQNTKDKITDGGKNNQDDLKTCLTDTVTALDLVSQIKHLPVSAIMLHARSFEQPFDGQPKLEILQQVRQIWPGLLIANGGLTSPEIAIDTLKQIKVDGLGIARGAWGKPWIFKQIKDYLATSKYETLDWTAIKKIMLQHAELALKTKGDYGLIELRKHLSWYVKGFANASDIRSQLVQIKTLSDVKKVLQIN